MSGRRAEIAIADVGHADDATDRERLRAIEAIGA